MLSRPTKIILVIIILAVFVFQIWWMFFGPGKGLITNSQDRLSQIPSWPPALADYRIEEMSPQFQELWTESNVYILENPGRECKLFAFQNDLLFEASFAQNDPRTLNRANLETGEMMWQTILDPEGTHVITHNENAIFFGSGATGNIIAYDLESGEQIWGQSLSSWRKNIIDYMQATEKNLYVNSSPEDFNVFDTHTGQPQDWESELDVFPVFHVEDDVIYHQKNNSHLQAVDRKTGNIIWGVSFDEPVLMPPIFIEEFVFVKTGQSGIGQVYAIDRITGGVLWQRPPGKINWENQENVMGTIAEDNGYIFYLTFDGQLQVLNAITGQLLGKVQFTPSLQELDAFDRINREFCVAANDNVVVVYLGSGRQLFAFRFLPDN